ncbi:MAG: 4-hydroxy-tetrahydrodipicolinate synthase [Candidatus Bipolaricaulota bacterium]|nr:4-hydroxy-tetrahydrodipicolinate synthase [Candidatus Bipolaricaulota bacterium]MCS7274489.1 4-hydroxy-tetrahydrodipicolinate synthase [Candidatus Bipolaricaulota bacterium]MDW8111114.1 4-hydroxy-tetrahydrodipicolinate synthase [Candidatus Bipolaricaulota bacterium]MDW8329056.1 4-hydroxy-tetrahydrodipicolinate synthase [Candidatus Bipolaricaulota bacterium]
MNLRELRGSIVALVTPFTAEDRIDRRALQRLVEFQIESGTDAISPCGTTGEAPTLSEGEYEEVIGTVVETVKKRVPVIAGAGSNNTAKAIQLSKLAEKLGADGILSVGPYYNKPTQEGFYQHFKAIADAVGIPVLLYNVPGRTGANIETKTVLRLAQIENIFGMKEASASLPQMMELLRSKPEDFRVYSGDDAFALALIACGGDGVVSVAANQIPRAIKELCDAALRGDFVTARQIHYKYLGLMNANFLESNPIPVKCTLAMMGLIEERYRLPLTPPSEETRQRLRQILQELGIIH